VAAQFRHRRIRHHRSGKRRIHAGLCLSGLCAGPRLRRTPRGDRLSKPRHNQTFEGLALDEPLRAKDATARCGLLIVDTVTGTTVEWLRFEHTIEELYDVAVLPGVRQAEAIGFRGDDIQREISPERRE
jgi:hypothetical protein